MWNDMKWLGIFRYIIIIINSVLIRILYRLCRIIVVSHHDLTGMGILIENQAGRTFQLSESLELTLDGLDMFGLQ